MTVVRLTRCLFILAALALARPSASFAQVPLRTIEPRSLTLQTEQLRCLECDCARARSDTAILRREYQDVHRKASMRGQRGIMTAGLAGAGAVIVGTYMVRLFGPLVQNDNGVESARFQDRTLLTGSLLMLVPLTIGLFGASKYLDRKHEVAPYRERAAELRVAYTEARRSQKGKCRGVY